MACCANSHCAALLRAPAITEGCRARCAAQLPLLLAPGRRRVRRSLSSCSWMCLLLLCALHWGVMLKLDLHPVHAE